VIAAQLDLCSQKSVKEAAAAFGAKHPRLEFLVLNAAVMATPFKLTEDGYEEQMAATHFGHFALAGLLMDKCVSVAPGCALR
jgi:NAD(P)-dependent dehydrogenase (short-subunit alcohol dehydrogenase family)